MKLWPSPASRLLTTDGLSTTALSSIPDQNQRPCVWPFSEPVVGPPPSPTGKGEMRKQAQVQLYRSPPVADFVTGHFKLHCTTVNMITW